MRNGQALSNGNLDVVGGSSWQRSVSTMSMSSGKWYWEYEITASNEHIIGVGPFDMQMSGNLGAEVLLVLVMELNLDKSMELVLMVLGVIQVDQQQVILLA